MGPPGSAVQVEVAERLLPRRHVGKAAQPDEAIRITEIAELPDDPHACGFLSFHEFPVEQLDESVAGPGIERVLPEIDDRAAGRAARAVAVIRLMALHGDRLLLRGRGCLLRLQNRPDSLFYITDRLPGFVNML